jgi:hypothetical protein
VNQGLPAHPESKAMRDYLVGLAVMIFVVLFATYLFAPDVYHLWTERLFLAP